MSIIDCKNPHVFDKIFGLNRQHCNGTITAAEFRTFIRNLDQALSKAGKIASGVIIAHFENLPFREKGDELLPTEIIEFLLKRLLIRSSIFPTRTMGWNLTALDRVDVFHFSLCIP